jgi:dihydroxy-acid dehydratase
VIRPFERALVADAGFMVLTGNLFESAIMKTSVISQEFRSRYLEDPEHPGVFEGRAVVFEGPEDYRRRIDDPSLHIDDACILVTRGNGPVGYPGSAEVVNMQPPADLIKRGVHALPCLGDGRQSGTSGSPSILNASPEAAVGGGLALLRTGDTIRVDLVAGRVDVMLSEEELEERRRGDRPEIPESQTPWQEIQRSMVGQMSTGMTLEPAVAYQRIAATKGVPRHNH